MEVQMVLREIGEHRGVEFDAAHSGLRQCMRGDFHGSNLAAGILHLPEQILHIQRFRSGSWSGKYSVSDLILHRTDKASSPEHCLADVFEKKGGRCFSVGPR